MLKKFIVFLMCGTLFFATFSMEAASATTTEETDPYLELLAENSDLIKFMEGLEVLPKGIEKQGAEKVAKWLTNKTGLEVVADGENLIIPSLATPGMVDVDPIDSDTITTMGIGECIVAVGLMLATTGFPLSKLLKLKKTIELLGGVSKSVERIYNLYTKYRSWNYTKSGAWKRAVSEAGGSLSGDAKLVFLEFFNLGNVYNNCL